jgi:hypothetical protein
MSVYTTRGSNELDVLIDTHLQRIAEVATPYCTVGILLGGYGRGEGTPFINFDGSQSPFNDYDLVVIVEKLNTNIRRTLRALEQQLGAELGLTVDLCPYQKNTLPKSEFSLLNYEMKYGHKVIWGDEKIIADLPDYSHSAIPLSEGSRLMLNRGKLLLDIQQRLKDPKPLSEEERICFIKFINKGWLAFGDAALLAAGKYELSYAVKKQRISEIAECPDHETIINRYRDAIALKDWGDFSSLSEYDIITEFNQVRGVFLQFFPWYRTQYSSAECSLLKAAALNLRWNGRPLPRHPRLYLYDALTELLKEDPCAFQLKQTLFSSNNYIERFYLLQRRFS